jgi:hypothetical protein
MPEDSPEDADSNEVTSMPSIGDVLTDFVDGVGSLAETFPLTMKAISTAYNKTLDKFQQFEKEKIFFEKMMKKRKKPPSSFGRTIYKSSKSLINNYEITA